MNPLYTVEGADHFVNDSRGHLRNPLFYPNFQNELNDFKTLLINLVNKKQGASFVHFGDGDYYFLKKQTLSPY